MFLNYIDARTGAVEKIFVGDSITVIDQAGNTMKYQLTNPASSIPWTPVPGTLRDKNGQKIGANAVPEAISSSPGQTVWEVNNSAYGVDDVIVTSMSAIDDVSVRGIVEVGEIIYDDSLFIYYFDYLDQP